MATNELLEYKDQLALIEEELKDNSTDEGLLEIQKELKLLIEELEQVEKDNELSTPAKKSDSFPAKSKPDSKTSKQSTSHDEEEQKTNQIFAQEKAFKKSTGKSSGLDSSKREYHVGQTVLAMASNKAFVPAKIALIAGSSTDPSYTVKFVKSGLTSTLKNHQLKEQTMQRFNSNPAKRKSNSVGTSNSGNPPSKAQKLNESQNKWQQFNQKMTKKKKHHTLG